MAGWWRGLTMLLLLVCSVSQCVASAGTRANYPQDLQVSLSKALRLRALLQDTDSLAAAPGAVPPVTRVTPPEAPKVPPAPPTPARTYLMWIGIGVFCLIIFSVAMIHENLSLNWRKRHKLSSTTHWSNAQSSRESRASRSGGE